MENRLINEQSPYLLQHAHNPVDWYAWGDEPFERARKESKPVLVSIGYAACHWCHVMEHESFENEAVAAYMNEHFINIKVDREEHPDVDHLYMDAVQAISGSGGWPLNVFVTPERLPFYGGTYFPPRAAYSRISWMELLQRMVEIWTQKPEEIKMQTDQMVEYLKQASQVGTTGRDTILSQAYCGEMTEALLKQADTEFGGFGKAPKFPGTMAISYLLEYAHYTKDDRALKHALHSLDAMVQGGIYDQLGGGFARYSTDAQWLAPHFEKMLYDNALLIWSLCDAYLLTREERYRKIIEETVSFVERELMDVSGLFYSALDADSEGEEGRFYTWTWEEWAGVVGADDVISRAYFGVSEEGNWEHTNILHVAKPVREIAAEQGISEEVVSAHLTEVKKRLFQARSGRVRPLTDDKSLLSWNALMNTALTKVGVALQSDAYLQKASVHADLLLEHFDEGGKLRHTWKKGKARINANLDDYAYLIQALLQLGSATGRVSYLVRASALCEVVIGEFQHEESAFFYYTSALQVDIPVRKVDVYDGATPSANAVMAGNLSILGLIMERAEWRGRAYEMLHNIADMALRYTYSFGYWAILTQRNVRGLKTVISTGGGGEVLQQQLQQHFVPHCYFLTSKKEISDIPILAEKNISGETLIFVCTEQECLTPVATVNETLQLISAY